MPDIPNEFTHHLLPDKTFDVDTSVDGTLTSNLEGGFDARHSGSLQTIVSGKLDTENVLTLKGDASAPVATDSKLEILNLPRFTLQDIKDMMKVRVHIPNYTNVCLKVLGVEMLSVCVSGEAQIITEPYVANVAERCETNCCEPDTRPFPDSQTNPTGANAQGMTNG
ncbi:MAG: hypothetical protein ABJA35_01750 [Parafilimonas sp.]